MKARIGGSNRLHRVLGCVAVVLLLAAAGCGGDSKAQDASGADKSGADAGAAGSTSTTEAGAAGADNKAKAAGKGGKGSGSSTTTTTAPGSSGSITTLPEEEEEKTMPISAELAETCVRPGGSQSITIKAEPASGVGFDSVYSDGKSGMMEGFYGGNAGGFSDEEGTFVATWVVGANAPEGPVIVRVLGTHVDAGFGETRAYFAVSNALGTCAPLPEYE